MELQRKNKEIIIDLAFRVRDILSGRFGDNMLSLCLFGSVARNSFKEGSDIDFLLILKEASSSYHKRVKEILPVIEEIRMTKEYGKVEDLRLDIEPSFLIFTSEEIKRHPPILIDIVEEGLILEDKGDFLKKQLEAIKERLKSLGAVRKTTPQGHYWVLKPDIKAGEIIKL